MVGADAGAGANIRPDNLMRRRRRVLGRVLGCLILATLALSILVTATVGFYTKYFVLESFQVEVGVTAVVEGAPSAFTERIQCSQHYQPHTFCPSCVGWGANFRSVRHLLPSGGVFTLWEGFSCAELADVVLVDEGSWQSQWRSGCAYSVAWSNDAKFPTIVESYNRRDSRISAALARTPRIRVETIRLQYRRGPTEPYYLGLSQEYRNGEPVFWRTLQNWFRPSERNPGTSGRLSHWASHQAHVITRSAWSEVYELPAGFVEATRPMRITDVNDQRIIGPLTVQPLRQQIEGDLGCWSLEGLSFDAFTAPIVPGLDGIWRIDLDQAGVGVSLREGYPGPGGVPVAPLVDYTGPSARIVPELMGPIMQAAYAGSLDARGAIYRYVYDPATENIYRLSGVE